MTFKLLSRTTTTHKYYDISHDIFAGFALVFHLTWNLQSMQRHLHVEIEMSYMRSIGQFYKQNKLFFLNEYFDVVSNFKNNLF